MNKGKGSKKIIIILVAVVVVVLGGMTVISQTIGKKEVLPTVATVKSVKGDIEENLDTTGTVESQNKKTFFSPVNATIKVLGMEAGDSVKADTKLVTFDVEDLEKENKKAELNIRSGNLDIQDTLDSANTAAAKQSNAAYNANVLQDAVDSQKAYIKQLQDAIAGATSQAATDSVDAAKQAISDQKAALKATYDAEVKAYKKLKTTYDAGLAKLKTAYDTALGTYNTASSNYNVAFEVWKATPNSTNKSALDTANSALSKAEIAFDNAKAAYETEVNNAPAVPAEPDYSTIVAGDTTVVADTAELQAELEVASSDLAELQAELSQEKAIAESDVAGVSAATLEKLDITTNLAELEAKTIEELIADGKKGLTAEFNGVISSCNIVEGAMVTQGMELFTLQSTEDVSVEITISKNDYEKVIEGQSATITMGDNTYHGTVTKVNRIATPNEKGTPVIGAKIQINDPDENIFIGVDAKVKVEVAKVKDVIMVPIAAVNLGNEGSFCYVVENDMIVKKNVETGISSTDYVEIKSGLEVDADVLTDIGTNAEGDKVTAYTAISEDGNVATEETEETAAGTDTVNNETE